jgi:deoxyribodipyrimidine photo-lyase
MKARREGFAEPTPTVRVRRVNDQPIRANGRYVLYWMIATRRPAFNFSLDRAVAWATSLELPIVVLEALRVDYPWASDRLHRFVIDGMRGNHRAFARSPVLHYPYVEQEPGAGRDLLPMLGREAAVVITDEYPCFFLPHMVQSAGRRLDVRLEAIDCNGLIPLAGPERLFAAAAHFRRHVQKTLRLHLMTLPAAHPFQGTRFPRVSRLPPELTRRWPAANPSLLSGSPQSLARLPIDHDVRPAKMRGGSVAARRRLQRFVGTRLSAYHLRGDRPEGDGTSRLSPYLHFGHISTHEIFAAVMRDERWSMRQLGPKATGSREGWWGVGPGAEAFLDQLVVWRELAFNACAMRPDDYDRFESLPAWARTTLDTHATDPRPHVYSRSELESAATHDALWNTAQNNMRREGWVHNYMRMLWGKKILEWSSSPREALASMIAIMNRWSLDGRDPNSYAGYMWTLGRYDRPWPERPIYGKVRSMSSARAAKKLGVRGL